MALETMHGQGFYETMAKKSPLLRSIIDGETTLRATLDGIIESNVVGTEDLYSVLNLIGNLSQGGVGGPAEDFPYTESLVQKLTRWGISIAAYSASGAAGGVITALLLAISPPVGLAALFGSSTGLALGNIALEDKVKKHYQEKLRQKRAEALKPVYEIAAAFDRDISLAFIFDYFRQDRGLFERVYRGLSSDEHQIVDGQLLSYLGAGGLPGMDEIQLKRYLSGLPGQEEGA